MSAAATVNGEIILKSDYFSQVSSYNVHVYQFLANSS